LAFSILRRQFSGFFRMYPFFAEEHRHPHADISLLGRSGTPQVNSIA